MGPADELAAAAAGAGSATAAAGADSSFLPQAASTMARRAEIKSVRFIFLRSLKK
jgi:hypothetical protein